MFEDIQKHRQAVRENIEKSLQIGYTESEDFEKAHQVGDVHPNGKWVWTQLPSGKFDWRVIKVKPRANTGGGAGIMGKTAPSSAVQNNPSLSAKQQAIQQQMATQSKKTNGSISGLSHNYDEETKETWYEGTVNGKRVRVLQEKVGSDSWWNLEVGGKLVRNADGKAMSFESVKEAAEEAKEESKNL